MAPSVKGKDPQLDNLLGTKWPNLRAFCFRVPMSGIELRQQNLRSKKRRIVSAGSSMQRQPMSLAGQQRSEVSGRSSGAAFWEHRCMCGEGCRREDVVGFQVGCWMSRLQGAGCVQGCVDEVQGQGGCGRGRVCAGLCAGGVGEGEGQGVEVGSAG